MEDPLVLWAAILIKQDESSFLPLGGIFLSFFFIRARLKKEWNGGIKEIHKNEPDRANSRPTPCGMLRCCAELAAAISLNKNDVE